MTDTLTETQEERLRENGYFLYQGCHFKPVRQFEKNEGELCFELKRWPDLMRAHHAGTIDIYSYIPNLVGKSTPLYFPILRKMIDLNPNLEQTDGY